MILFHEFCSVFCVNTVSLFHVTTTVCHFLPLLHSMCGQLAEFATLIWYISQQEVATNSCQIKLWCYTIKELEVDYVTGLLPFSYVEFGIVMFIKSNSFSLSALTLRKYLVSFLLYVLVPVWTNIGYKWILMKSKVFIVMKINIMVCLGMIPCRFCVVTNIHRNVLLHLICWRWRQQVHLEPW